MRLRTAVAVCARTLLAGVALAVLPVATLLLRKRRAALIWGSTPIINIKYWSHALREAGWESRTLVSTFYSTINRREDYDLVFDDLVPSRLPSRLLRSLLGPYLAFLHVVRHAAVMHVSFDGGALGQTPLWRLEGRLLRRAGIPVVAIPYGSDVFMYSRVQDPTARSGLMRSYPEAGRREDRIEARVRYWSREASVIVVGFTLDGLPRWDIPAGNMVVIDTDAWACKTEWSSADGRTEPVRILHTPNHRGAKGTEFLMHAVESLRGEGLELELVLAERLQNEDVRRLMGEVDVLADQVILPGYGLAAIEGMASGLPVICNLDHPSHTALFDRYSFLGECPVVSATPESVERVLRALVTSPELRRELGRAGRSYVEKYHAYEAAQYLFGSIYERLLRGSDVELATLFHPLSSPFNRRSPPISHPLEDHRLPRRLLDDAPWSSSLESSVEP